MTETGFLDPEVGELMAQQPEPSGITIADDEVEIPPTPTVDDGTHAIPGTPSAGRLPFPDFLASLGLVQTSNDYTRNYAFARLSGDPVRVIDFMGSYETGSLSNLKAICNQHKFKCECWIIPRGAHAQSTHHIDLFRALVLACGGGYPQVSP